VTKNLSRLAFAALICVCLAPVRTAAQNGALWLGVSANWSDAGAWLCSIAGNNGPVPCVPNGNFTIDSQGAGGGTLNVDINVNVIGGTIGQTNLTMNGTSLTATGGFSALSAQLTGATLTAPSLELGASSSFTSSTVTASNQFNLFGSLQLSKSTLNAASSGLRLTGSNTWDSSTVNISSLVADQLSISNMSVIVPNAIEADGGLQLDNATLGAKTNLTVGGGSNNFFGATLNVGSTLALDGTLTANIMTATTTGAIIGNNGTGVVDAASTSWNTDLLVLGQSPGTSGKLTLGGLATLTLGGIGPIGISGSIAVGDSGQGTLIVQNGVIASSPGALTILSIGTNASAPGNGQVSILSGGQVSVSDVLVGFSFPGTTATLAIDGQGSQLNLLDNGGGVQVGGGTVTVTNSAIVNGGNLDISQGQVTLDSSSQWTVTGPANQPDLVIGSFVPSSPAFPGSTGVASFTIQGGATGSSQASAFIGANSGSNGTMTITGTGSAWSSTGAVIVGLGGTGTLNIQAGGVLTSGPGGFESQVPGTSGVSGDVGGQAGSVGTVTIDGAGSAWNQTGAIRVGDAATGTVTIQNGGVLSTGSDGSLENLSGVIGVQSTGQGTLTVTGDNSEWQAGGNVQVGASGTGALNIMDSGKVSADDLSVGAEAGGQGTVTMNGGTLELTGKLTVGDAGQGTLTVVPGAPDDEGDITSMDGSIGAQIGSSGSVTIGSAVGQGIQATSSQWTVKGELVIGEAGSGTLDIGGNVSDLTATIGKQSTGNGTVTVENGGMWTTTNDLTVGDSGIGNLNIRTGGIAIVQFGQGVDVGSKSGSVGNVDVQGQWNMTQGLTIGSLGTGTMTIEGGGAVASGDGDIGLGPGSKGTVTVTGSGTTWSVDGTLAVGEGGMGTLNIVNGGLVLSRDGIIGKDSSGVGVVNVSGAGSQWKATFTGGTGTITVGSAGTGTLNVVGGGQVIATSVVVNPTGTLNGQGGMIVANLVNNGGVISPGDATGTLMVTGNYTQNTGATMFEIDGPGPGQFDQLIISGLASFNGGTIDINFANNFLPTAGEDFALISALSLSNLGVTVDVTGLPAGFVFAENFTSSGFDLFTQQTPGGAPTPEPSTWLLLTSGLASLTARFGSRRKKALRPGRAGEAWL
jgi:T5SS/PEP-CTERM-associated repeat protein